MKLLNILFNPLNFLNMFTLYLGGGGGGGGTPSATSASNTVSNIAPWAQAGVSQLINSGLSNAFPQYGQQLNAYNQQMQMYNNFGGANNIYGLAAPTAPTDLGNQGGYTPFNTNTATNPTVNQKTIVDASGVPQANPNYNPAMSQAYQAAQSTTAGFTPLQQQSFTTAANMQVPGQYGTASNMATQAGQGALNTTGQAGQYGKMGAQYGAQGAQQAGQLAGNVANQAQGYGSQAAQAGNIGLQTGQNMANTGQLGLQYGQQAAQAGNIGLQTGQNMANTGQLGLQYGQQGANYGAQGAAAGQSYGQQAQNPGAVQSYMNPYLQSTLAPQMQLLNQQYGMQQNQNDANAIQAGAFGGSGAMLQKSLNQQNQLLAGNQLTSNAYNQAYNVANQNMQNAASLGMQGAGVGLQGSAAGQAGVNTALQGQQGQLAGLSAYQQGSAAGQAGVNIALQGQQGQLAGLSAYQQGLQGAQQGLNTALGAGNLRLSGTAQGIQGAQTGLAGVNAQQAGYGQAGNQATNLANIGSQQQNAAQNIAGLQNAYGAQQQQQQQNIYNTANQNYSTMQAYPMQQLQQLESMYTGAPTNTTTMNYQAAPSTLSQVAGLGLAGYGASQLGTKANKKGGQIKEGGIDKLPANNLKAFKKGGITMDTEDDGAVHFADNRQQPVGSYQSGPFTAADYSLGTQDPRIYRDNQLNPSQKFTRTQLQLLEQSPGSGASLTGYPNANSGAVLGGQQYPRLSPGVLSQFLQAQQNLPDSSAVTNGPTSKDNIAANGNPDGQQQNTTPYTYKAPQVGLPNLLSTSSMSAADAKKNATQFLNPADLNAEAKNLDSYFENQTNTRRAARDAELAGRPILGKKQEERLNKEDEKDTQRLSDLKNSSMLEAGLAVLGGTSPFFGPNISNAKEGVQAYKAGLKDLEKAKEARENVRSNLENMRDAQLNNDINSSLQFEDNAFNAHMGLKGHLFDAKNNMNTALGGIASNMFQSSNTNALNAGIANLNAQTHVATTNAMLNKEPEAIATARILGKGDVQAGYNMGIAKQHATELYTKWAQLAYPNGNLGQPNEAFLKAYPTAQLYVEEGLSSAGFAPQGGNAGGYGKTPPPPSAAILNSKR